MAKHRTSPAPPLTSHCVAQDIPARLTLHHLASERDGLTLVQTPILSSAESNQALPLAACAKSATVSASFATVTCALAHWSASVTNAITAPIRYPYKQSNSFLIILTALKGRCVICGGPGISDAYYCKECTVQEKDRDGCPKIVNLGSSKTDLFYERKKYGFKKR